RQDGAALGALAGPDADGRDAGTDRRDLARKARRLAGAAEGDPDGGRAALRRSDRRAEPHDDRRRGRDHLERPGRDRQWAEARPARAREPLASAGRGERRQDGRMPYHRVVPVTLPSRTRCPERWMTEWWICRS